AAGTRGWIAATASLSAAAAFTVVPDDRAADGLPDWPARGCLRQHRSLHAVRRLSWSSAALWLLRAVRAQWLGASRLAAARPATASVLRAHYAHHHHRPCCRPGCSGSGTADHHP